MWVLPDGASTPALFLLTLRPTQLSDPGKEYVPSMTPAPMRIRSSCGQLENGRAEHRRCVPLRRRNLEVYPYTFSWRTRLRCRPAAHRSSLGIRLREGWGRNLGSCHPWSWGARLQLFYGLRVGRRQAPNYKHTWGSTPQAASSWQFRLGCSDSVRLSTSPTSSSESSRSLQAQRPREHPLYGQRRAHSSSVHSCNH